MTGAFILTMAVAVISLIAVMFGSGSVPGRRSVLFGALFFEVREGTAGAIDIGVGLDNPVVAVVIFGVTTVFLIAVLIVLDRLRAYKRQLNAPNDA